MLIIIQIVGAITTLLVCGYLMWKNRRRETEYQRGWRNARESCKGKDAAWAKAQYANPLYAPDQTEFDEGWRDWIHSHYPNDVD